MSKKESNKPTGLGSLVLQESKVVEIVNLTGQPVGIRMTLASPYSDIMQSHNRKVRDQVQQYMRSIGSPRKLSPAQQRGYDELIQQQVEDRLVSGVLGWDSDSHPGNALGSGGAIESLDGKIMECTTENVRALLIDKRLGFLKEQLAGEFNDELGFQQP